MVNTEKREINGEIKYYCYICDAWVKGKEWDGTGYTQLVCADCGLTLDDDYYGTFELERTTQ